MIKMYNTKKQVDVTDNRIEFTKYKTEDVYADKDGNEFLSLQWQATARGRLLYFYSLADFEIKDNRVAIPEFLPEVKCKVLQHEIDFSEKATTKNDRLNEAENKITDIMIYLYQVYNRFHRLDKTEVEMAHEIWLDLKNVRSKIETLKNQK